MNSQEQARIEALIRYLEHKRVVVIGNSESQFSQYLGARIDSFDVVVRMNLGSIRAPEHQGTRTDIVFTSSEKLTADMIDNWFKPSWVVWATPKREKMPDLSALGERLVLHPVDIWETLHARIEPARPSTGLIALNFFANHCRCADLAFAGFDFFASGTFYNRKFFGLIKHPRKASKPHDGAEEQRVVSDMIASGQMHNLAAAN
ncbi:glycosyltransferase family 29 protein [Azoarcus sp. L1K30]|uniref:glycosyltransferase family 29 protein n=1 Tax=Azoarcus sp. L1K30 TaxID=2820277 RepID=UPI001B82960B|nr:glycosyltransferase family 29 protein [Azoarcus sp. L1K30]MBR0566813.1 glycosyltransferase family 29 protein [Azoarcus sp. L1K30]